MCIRLVQFTKTDQDVGLRISMGDVKLASHSNATIVLYATSSRSFPLMYLLTTSVCRPNMSIPSVCCQPFLAPHELVLRSPKDISSESSEVHTTIERHEPRVSLLEEQPRLCSIITTTAKNEGASSPTTSSTSVDTKISC